MNKKRLFFTILALFIQFAVLFAVCFFLSDILIYYSIVSAVASLFFGLAVMARDDSPEYKMTWIFFILFLPVFGGVLYLMLGDKKKSYVKKFNKNHPVSEAISNDFENKVSNLIHNANGTVIANANVKYYQCGEDAYEMFLQKVSGAEKSICLEYFIISRGSFLDRLKEILFEKVRQGVAVRIIYDDLGSINCFSSRDKKEFESHGVKVAAFNRFVPRLRSGLNYRDHRKMCIVDETFVFSGGINIADEYVNRIERFGYWKDNVFSLSGDAALDYYNSFATVWNEISSDDKMILRTSLPCCGSNLVQNWFSSPFMDFPLVRNVYLGLLSQAKKSIFITTPYLVLDADFRNALSVASKSGVDVRIIIPGIPDKKTVYKLTLYYANLLVKDNVKVFVYTKGFIHEKLIVVDSVLASVGTANFDYRSLFLHFECGTLFYSPSDVSCVLEDFSKTCAQSSLIKEYKEVRGLKKIWISVLKIASPML